MGLTVAQRAAHAAELIRAAEYSLGQLTPGQRRDLVADRTDWDSASIREAVLAFDRPTEVERQALAKFKADYGREWKQYLMAAWLSHSHRGLNMGGRDAGTLRAIRNERGHGWLLDLTPADLEPPKTHPTVGRGEFVNTFEDGSEDRF